MTETPNHFSTETRMTDKFSWSKVYRRRIELADAVAKKLELTQFRLIGDIKGSFHSFELTGESLAEQPMWKVPFYVVAQHMKEVSEHHHVIDHAWWLIANDRSDEPWGFVTEPYIDADAAETMAAELNLRHQGWGVTTEVWPSDKSPWYPGHTVPIVTVGSVGMLHSFLRCGVRAALDEMVWRG
jgi:hypothetical protein